jgi:hypothetical protein
MIFGNTFPITNSNTVGILTPWMALISREFEIFRCFDIILLNTRTIAKNKTVPILAVGIALFR